MLPGIAFHNSMPYSFTPTSTANLSERDSINLNPVTCNLRTCKPVTCNLRTLVLRPANLRPFQVSCRTYEQVQGIFKRNPATGLFCSNYSPLFMYLSCRNLLLKNYLHKWSRRSDYSFSRRSFSSLDIRLRDCLNRLFHLLASAHTRKLEN